VEACLGANGGSAAVRRAPSIATALVVLVMSGGVEFVGRGRGFSDHDPTGTAALDPRRSQIRRAARQAAHLIEQAELTLEEASGVIANGYLRLDPQEWVRAVEKRRAALGR
jgi:hypothetical protein